jgi:hypothetical protein
MLYIFTIPIYLYNYPNFKKWILLELPINIYVYIVTEDFKAWYKNGKYHCEDGPAYISANGKYKAWWLNGELHRDKLQPAVINGDLKMWWINGKLHREDGPAVINGKKEEWRINGKLHREDGPAVINEKKEEWRINNILRNEEWVKKYLKIKNKHMIDGVIVSDYWKIREVILRWRYNPALKCVWNRLIKEYNAI